MKWYSLSSWSLKKKIITIVIVVALSIGGTAAYLFENLIKTATHENLESFFSYANSLDSAISAQFYERYGDVQAFAMNPILQKGSKSQVIEALNNYAVLYGIYDLILVVDKSGRLVATNNKGPDGAPLKTDALYNRNFSQDPWFSAVMNNSLTEQKEKNFTGTFVEQPSLDPIVSAVYEKEMYESSFSSAIKDSSGELIGVITNRAGFRWVEGEFQDLYRRLSAAGMKKAEFYLINQQGKLLVSYAPHENGDKIDIVRDFKELNKTSLIESGYEPAKLVTAGKSGSLIAPSFKSKEPQLAGFSSLKGPKFVDHLGWNVVVAMDEEYADAWILSARRNFLLLFGLISISSIVLATIFSSRLSAGLQRILRKLQVGADTTSVSSQQVSSISRSLTEGTTEQAESIQETAASIDEVTAMTKKNSENARLSQASSNKSKDAAEEGQRAVQDMITSINEISKSNTNIMNQIETSNQKISEIIKVISEIGEKTKVINDIVFQTKLLSFNASVEAARAGEHGKGFAVVAEEVGNLAQMSGNAAQEISSMLSASIQKVENIVTDTKSQVERLIQDGKQKVSSGIDVAGKCGQALKRILDLVKQVDGMVAEITSASSEQATGISEINKAMNQLDQVTQKNKIVSEQCTEASTRLLQQSEDTKNVVAELSSLFEGGASSPKSDDLSGNSNSSGGNGKQDPRFDNVVPIKTRKKSAVPEQKLKSVIGEASALPRHDDPRFVEV